MSDTRHVDQHDPDGDREVVDAVDLPEIDTPHSLSSCSIGPVEMLVVDTAAVDRLRAQHPDVWLGLMLRVAQRLRARLRVATAHLANHGEALEPIGTTRLEKDSLGARELPASSYCGVQTLRATATFPISGQRLHSVGAMGTALAMVKKSAAQADRELGVLDDDDRPRPSPPRVTRSSRASCDATSSWT